MKFTSVDEFANMSPSERRAHVTGLKEGAVVGAVCMLSSILLVTSIVRMLL